MRCLAPSSTAVAAALLMLSAGMASGVSTAALATAVNVTAPITKTCGALPPNQLFRDAVNADTECGTECSVMCFQTVQDANLYFAGDFQSVVGTNSQSFLEECTGKFIQAGHDISCTEVRDDQGSIKVVVHGPEDDLTAAREASRVRTRIVSYLCFFPLLCSESNSRGWEDSLVRSFLQFYRKNADVRAGVRNSPCLSFFTFLF